MLRICCLATVTVALDSVFQSVVQVLHARIKGKVPKGYSQILIVIEPDEYCQLFPFVGLEPSLQCKIQDRRKKLKSLDYDGAAPGVYNL